jgi:hypothetical protein
VLPIPQMIYVASFKLSLALAVFSILLQANTCAAASQKAVNKGTWAGDHIVLEVSENGAQVEFDCAHGQVTQPVKVDKQGNFKVAGTFTPEHGGPVRRDENPESAPVTYSGQVNGDTMTLTITRGEEKLGDYTLTRGAQPRLMKCR